MILFIDTANFNHIHFAVVGKNKLADVAESFHEFAYNENYKTANFLNRFLKNHRIDLSIITKIIVWSGPGSFTGIRVGVTLAQALGFALNIPVLAVPKNKLPKNLAKLSGLRSNKKMALHYGKALNITTLPAGNAK